MYRLAQLVLATGLALVLVACSDDSAEGKDGGARLDLSMDVAAADLPGGPDAGSGQPDSALADVGSPDAAVVTPGWAITAGGTGDDFANSHRGLAVDSQDNIYLAGDFEGDITFGSTQLTTKGDRDGWVVKLSPAGKVLWAVQIGGTHDTDTQYVNSICLDSKGTPYIMGSFNGSVTLGSTAYTSKSSDTDYYAVSLSPADGKVAWSMAGSTTTASDKSSLQDCAFDSAGKLLAVGYLEGSYTFGSTTVTASDTDILLLRLSADLSTVEQASALGGTSDQRGTGLALGPGGEMHLAGYFETSITLGSVTTAAKDSYEMWTAQLSSAGKVNWAVTGLGDGIDLPYGVVVDSNGESYLFGYIGGQQKTAGTFKIGTFKLPVGTDREMFLAQLSKAGKVLWAEQSHYETTSSVWATEVVHGAALDAQGRLLVATSCYRDMSFFGQTLNPPNPGGFSVGLGRFASDMDLQWVTSYGHPSTQYIYGTAVAVDSKGDIVLVGNYMDKVTLGNKTFTSVGGRDIFVHKTTPAW